MARYYTGSEYRKTYPTKGGLVTSYSLWGDRETKEEALKAAKELRKEGFKVRTQPVSRHGETSYYLIWVK